MALVVFAVAVIILSISLLISRQSSSLSASSTSTISSSASVSVASSSSISSSSLDYNNIITAISSMNDKEKATLLEEFINYATTTSKDTTTITTTDDIEYNHRKLNRLLQSSSPIKVTGNCDMWMKIYINGVQVSQPAYFNPANDTLAIQGGCYDNWDVCGPYRRYCRIYFNDIPIPISILQNRFKCAITNGVDAAWSRKTFDDSTWGTVIQSQDRDQYSWWVGSGYDDGYFFCRHHHEGITCKDGSEPYGGQCWCGYDYKSSTGLGPCVPCDDNANTNTLGSTKCKCAASSFSGNGYDTPDSCESCPG